MVASSCNAMVGVNYCEKKIETNTVDGFRWFDFGCRGAEVQLIIVTEVCKYPKGPSDEIDKFDEFDEVDEVD